ncbi:hypothetical protein PTKIN_Ptkin05aG0070000 [Pterospermum kingtungense]
MALSKLFFFFFPLFFLQPSTNGQTCPLASCGNITVEFPYRLSDQPDCCGNPDFSLSCKNQSQTIISFRLSGDFIVDALAYSPPSVLISDPENCLAIRLLEGIELSGDPFEPVYPESYTFFNCSSSVLVGYPAVHFSCLSDANFSVLAVPTFIYNQSNLLRSCLLIATISIPLATLGWPDYIDNILLTWEEPDCQWSCNNCGSPASNCELDGGCSDDNDDHIKKKKGTPFFLAAVLIINYRVRVQYHDQSQQSTVEISSLAADRQLTATAANGLDGSRIEAYPITLLDESFQLPRPNDNTCSICLSEYKAKETIRTTPDCSHYFHADCIDEWLKRNAACPVCRNKPDQESALRTLPTLASS